MVCFVTFGRCGLVMSFIVARLIWFATQPGVILTVLLALGVVLLWTRKWRWGRRLITIALITGFTISFSGLPGFLLSTLENRFPANPPLPENIDGIIVLGGSVNQFRARDRHQIDINDGAERLFGFVDLAQRYPAAKLVFTGGSGNIFNQSAKESEVARVAFSALGLPPERVVYEDTSRNTHENAALSKALVYPKPGETWVLVTSARHMPRSVGVFRGVGWPVVPWPVDYGTFSDQSWTPSGDMFRAVSMLNAALYEWWGLVWYRAAGYSTELFPAP